VSTCVTSKTALDIIAAIQLSSNRLTLAVDMSAKTSRLRVQVLRVPHASDVGMATLHSAAHDGQLLEKICSVSNKHNNVREASN